MHSPHLFYVQTLTVSIGDEKHKKNKLMNVDELIIELIRKFPIHNNSTKPYYDFIAEKLNEYLILINNLNEDDLIKIISPEFKANPTKKRFVNLEKNICSDSLIILSLIIRGDLFNAILRLKNLFLNNRSTQYKLIEPFINYLSIKYVNNKLYRIINWFENYAPQNCNHIPYEIREKAKSVRFNLNGYPCLYLSDSIEGCLTEINYELTDINTIPYRYYSEFMSNENSMLILFNFILPKESELSNLTDYEKFCFILTYPLYILCLSKNNTTFKYEYLFPQLLFHLLFLSEYNNFTYDIKGIAYSSTIDSKYTNFVIPAKMQQAIQHQGYSKYVLDLFLEKFKGELK